MDPQIKPRNLSVEAMARLDAMDAHYGAAVHNPYQVGYLDCSDVDVHAAWQSAFNSRLLELAHAELVAEAA